MQTGDPRKKLPLIDNVIAAVDVEGVSGAGFRRLMCEERNGKADVLGGHELAGRRFSLRFLQQGIELRYSRRSAGCERAGLNGVDPNPLRPQFGSDVAHCAFQRRFSDSHNIVIRAWSQRH